LLGFTGSPRAYEPEAGLLQDVRHMSLLLRLDREVVLKSDHLATGSPWTLVPLLWLLSYASALVAGFGLDLTYLFIPAAAYVAARYGAPGVAAVEVGGLLLPIGIRGALGELPARVDLYIIAVAIASMISSRRPIWEQTVVFDRLPILTAIVFFLPLAVDAYYPVLNSGTEIT